MSATPRQSLKSQVKPSHWHVCHTQTVPGNTAKSNQVTGMSATPRQSLETQPSQTKSLACLPHPDSPWKHSQVKPSHWHICHTQTAPGNIAKSSQTKSQACLPYPDSPWKHSQVKSNQVSGMSATPRQPLEIEPSQTKSPTVHHTKTVTGNTAKLSQTKSLACLPHQDSPWKHSRVKSDQVTCSPPHQDSPWKHSQIKPDNTSSPPYRMESLKTFSSNQVKLHLKVKPSHAASSCIHKSNQVASESQTKSHCTKLHPKVKPSKAASKSQTKSSQTWHHRWRRNFSYAHSAMTNTFYQNTINTENIYSLE